MCVSVSGLEYMQVACVAWNTSLPNLTEIHRSKEGSGGGTGGRETAGRSAAVGFAGAHTHQFVVTVLHALE